MVESLFSVLQHCRRLHDPTMSLPACPDDLRFVLSEELLGRPKQYGLNNRKDIVLVRLMKFPGQPAPVQVDYCGSC